MKLIKSTSPVGSGAKLILAVKYCMRVQGSGALPVLTVVTETPREVVRREIKDEGIRAVVFQPDEALHLCVLVLCVLRLHLSFTLIVHLVRLTTSFPLNIHLGRATELRSFVSFWTDLL